MLWNMASKKVVRRKRITDRVGGAVSRLDVKPTSCLVRGLRMQPAACRYRTGRRYDIVTWVDAQDGTRGKYLRHCSCEAGLELQRLIKEGKLGRDYLQYILKEKPDN